ncbi:MAG: hypothetical protein ABI946_00750 [Chthoniobacterales bacterium]
MNLRFCLSLVLDTPSFASANAQHSNLDHLLSKLPPPEKKLVKPRLTPGMRTLAPKDFLVQAQIGYCLYAIGRTDQAISHLRRGADRMRLSLP